jgi:2-polyprenyl-3-methyl-5-hydroxy-6-metoxy-1,4-benzoquinol methylase
MACERSNDATHLRDPHCKKYDETYYSILKPWISGDVLDLGAGSGMFIRNYKENATSVTAVDKYTDELEGVTVINQKLPSSLPLEKKFDVIVSTEFIEHITREELEPFIAEVKRLLKPEGIFIGSTPNKWLPTTNPFHLYEYTLEELREIFEKHFKIIEMFDDGLKCTVWKTQLLA